MENFRYINTSFQHYAHHAKSLMNKPYHCGFFLKIWDQVMIKHISISILLTDLLLKQFRAKQDLYIATVIILAVLLWT